MSEADALAAPYTDADSSECSSVIGVDDDAYSEQLPMCTNRRRWLSPSARSSRATKPACPSISWTGSRWSRATPGAARWMTFSTGYLRNASLSAWHDAVSTRTASIPRTSSRAAALGLSGLTGQIVLIPCCASRRATAPPMKPVAPVTRVVPRDTPPVPRLVWLKDSSWLPVPCSSQSARLIADRPKYGRRGIRDTSAPSGRGPDQSPSEATSQGGYVPCWHRV